jgi:hypothetical protein
MDNPYRTTNLRPANSELVYSLRLMKNCAAMWAMNGASVILLIFFGWLFTGYLNLIRPGILGEVISGSFKGLYFVIAILGIFCTLIVVHELVHGAFFWLFTHQRPKFGIRNWYAYAAAPGWYIAAREYLVIGLAPAVLLSAAGMILLAALPAEALIVTLFAVIVNAASSVGDLWIIFKLLGQRHPVIVEDRGDGVNFYTLQ